MTPEGVAQSLPKLVKHGARADRLLSDAPELVRFLRDLPPGSPVNHDDAVLAEQRLRKVIASLGPNEAAALKRLFALIPGLNGMPVPDRQSRAGTRLGVSQSTFRSRYQRPLLNSLAVEIYRDVRPQDFE